MYKDLCNEEFDYVIFGTSLTESTLTAYLSKLGKRVVVIDISSSYGGDCKNFNLREMEKFVQALKDSSTKDSILKQFKLLNRQVYTEDIVNAEDFRNYNFDLNPKFIYAKSKSTEELTSSNAANYLEFSSVKNMLFYYQGQQLNVPFSKSEIFTSNDLELLEKQKLLAFLYSIMKIKNKDVDVNSTTDIQKDYELDNAILSTLQSSLNEPSSVFLKKHFPGKIHSMITLILANTDPNCQTNEMTVDEMITKIYKFLLSVQIYDNAPFLYPSYGSSEFAQALCRLGAVYGAIFLINEKLKIQVELNVEVNANKSEDIIIEESKECKWANGNGYKILFTDEENKESFTFKAKNIATNEIFLSDLSSSVQFSNEILAKRNDNNANGNSNRKLLKYISYVSIKNITELRKNSGVVFYKIMKNDPLLNNCYGFSSIEYFPNTNSAPMNRTLIQIYINNDDKEVKEEVFIENCKGIADAFIKRRMDEIDKEIKEEYSKMINNKEDTKENRLKGIELILDDEEKKEIEVKQEENKEKIDESIKETVKDKEEGAENSIKEESKVNETEENKEEIYEEEKVDTSLYNIVHPQKQKEKMKLTPSIVFQYDFIQKVSQRNYDIIQKEDKSSNIYITKNDYIDIDLDFYYIECESIVKSETIAQELKELPKKIEEKLNKSNASEDTDLINELFNSLSIPTNEPNPIPPSTAESETDSKITQETVTKQQEDQ